MLLAAALKALDPTKNVHIVSTNYDDSMREIYSGNDAFALYLRNDLHVRFRDFATKRPTNLGARTIPIVHVHGLIRRTGRGQEVVFSEPDYVRWTNSGQLRDYLQGRFDHGHTLMVGTSLRD